MIHAATCRSWAGEIVRAITVEELRPEFAAEYATGETDGDKAAATIRQALKRALAAARSMVSRRGMGRGGMAMASVSRDKRDKPVTSATCHA